MLPIIDTYFVDLAQSAIDGACFPSDAEDQFLTMLAMENMSDYDGDGDFGTVTRIDLDDELGAMLTILALAAYQANHEITGIDADHHKNTASYYRAGNVLLGWSSDQRWWAEWLRYTPEEADKRQEEFANEYSAYLDANDPE